MIIIGAGMSGLLAGALNPGSVIYETGPQINNHKAVFRCKKPDIGKMLGIPFKKVTVHKAIWLDREVEPSPRITHMYSKKVSGIISSRSIFDTTTAIRYIPSENFTAELISRCHTIKYNTPINIDNFYNISVPIISTIPLFDIGYLLKLKLAAEFKYKPIFVNRIKIPDCNSQCTIYYPDPNFSAYRASIIGSTLITEGMKKLHYKDVPEIYYSLGLRLHNDPDKYQNHKQKFGKIIPIDNTTRTNLITKLTLDHGVYSLGRFATWRPKVMLDDVLEDILIIRRLIREGNYGSIKHQQETNHE